MFGNWFASINLRSCHADGNPEKLNMDEFDTNKRTMLKNTSFKPHRHTHNNNHKHCETMFTSATKMIAKQ